LNLEVKGSQLF